MKKLILLLSGMLLGSSCPAQSLAPSVIASSGASANLPGGSLQWTLGEVATTTFVMPGNALTQGFQQPFATFRASGTLRYLNTSLTPMNNSVAYLQNMAGQTLDSSLTTASGKYYFFHANPGTYKTHGKSAKAWGGVNATDALLIMKNYVGSYALQGLFKNAGDVNNSGILNSLDALLVARRFTGLISSFAAGDWRFSLDTVVVAAIPGQQDMSALCNGDVNGSLIPMAKTFPNITLLREGEQDFVPGMEFRFPFTARQDFRTGAISFVLSLPGKCYAVQDVGFGNKDGSLVWNQQNNELRIAWYSTSGANFQKDDLVLSLSMKVTEVDGNATEVMPLSVGEGSEIAGLEGDILPLIVLAIPRLRYIQPVGEAFFTCCNPNPAAGMISFSYGLAMPAVANLSLYNLTGQLIFMKELGLKPSGTFTEEMDCSLLPPGIYLLRFTTDQDDRNVDITSKLVLSY